MRLTQIFRKIIWLQWPSNWMRPMFYFPDKIYGHLYSMLYGLLYGLHSLHCLHFHTTHAHEFSHCKFIKLDGKIVFLCTNKIWIGFILCCIHILLQQQAVSSPVYLDFFLFFYFEKTHKIFNLSCKFEIFWMSWLN